MGKLEELRGVGLCQEDPNFAPIGERCPIGNYRRAQNAPHIFVPRDDFLFCVDW